MDLQSVFYVLASILAVVTIVVLLVVLILFLKFRQFIAKLPQTATNKVKNSFSTHREGVAKSLGVLIVGIILKKLKDRLL